MFEGVAGSSKVTSELISDGRALRPALVATFEVAGRALQNTLRLLVTRSFKLGGETLPALTSQGHDAAAFPKDADPTILGDFVREQLLTHFPTIQGLGKPNPSAAQPLPLLPNHQAGADIKPDSSPYIRLVLDSNRAAGSGSRYTRR